MNTTHLLLSIVIALLLFIIYLMKNYRRMMSIGKKNKPISTEERIAKLKHLIIELEKTIPKDYTSNPILKALLDKNDTIIKQLHVKTEKCKNPGNDNIDDKEQ